MKRNFIVFVFSLILFLLVAGYLSFSFFLPRYIEKNIIPDLGSQLSASITGQVFDLGLSSATLGNIVVGTPPNLAVSIGSINAVYTPASLFEKKLESININGLTLNLIFTDGNVLIPGIDLKKLAQAKTDKTETDQTSKISLPIELGSFQVTNGLLNIQYQTRRIIVPFTLEISQQKQQNSTELPVYLFNMKITPQGSEVTLAGTLDLPDNTGNLSFTADSFDLNSIAFLLGDLEKILRIDNAAISGNTDFKIMPFQLVSAELDSELDTLGFSNPSITFGASAENAEKITPVHLGVKGSRNQWDVGVQGHIAEPFSGFIDLKASLVKADESLTSSGTLLFRPAEIKIPQKDKNSQIIIKEAPDFNGIFSLDITSSGAWLAKLETNNNAEKKRRSQPVQIQYGQNTLKAKIPSLDIQGNGSAGAHEISATLVIPDVHISNDSLELSLPEARLQGSFKLKSDAGQENHGSGQFKLMLAGTKFKNAGLTGRTDIALQGSMEPQVLNMKTLLVKGKLAINKAKLEDQGSSFAIGSITGQIPLQWPLSGRKETTGRIKASQITWKNYDLGVFDAGIILKDGLYFLDGKYTSSFIKGIITNVSGKAGLADSEPYANLDLQMDPAPFSSLHLGRFDPSLNNSYLSGELGLDGSFKFDAMGLKGSMAVRMQNGRFELPEKKYTVNNISFSLFMPSLPDLRTAPAQTLHFAEASIGDLSFSKGKLVWQLESMDSFFLEEGVVGWAGGRIFTNAVRISPNVKEFVVPIFCDRLILSNILRQFGMKNAKGEGTVSGRIPMQVSKNTLSFEDGFLYSSPGQGGDINVGVLNLLSAGIPKNTPQFAQVDFAAEALKNFHYNWVRLILNTEGEDLIMQMQMDGKPMQPLPFKYDSRTGLLQRLEVSGKGIDQPIRLDINFHLPFNRFLGYSGKIQDIMKKMQ